MARIDVLPSIEIIRGFKGILDFYVRRGTPCVRAWPKYRPAKQTAASLASALLFGAIIKAWGLTHSAVLEQLVPETVGIPRTARDVVVSGIYGNLHEASMSDFLDLLTECRDFLSNLTAVLDALHSVDTDELVVRVEHSVLPDGAANFARQGTQLTALEKIDDLQDALQSKALDRLLVRGMDQLFTYNRRLILRTQAVISGAGGFLDSATPGAGELWVVTNTGAADITSPTTKHSYAANRAATFANFYKETAAFAAFDVSTWSGYVFLEPTDLVRVYFAGALAADICRIDFTGFVMTKEP